MLNHLEAGNPIEYKNAHFKAQFEDDILKRGYYPSESSLFILNQWPLYGTVSQVGKIHEFRNQ